MASTQALLLEVLSQQLLVSTWGVNQWRAEQRPFS
jgi:hypothetical protein